MHCFLVHMFSESGSSEIFLGDKRLMLRLLLPQNLVQRCIRVFEFRLWFFGSFCFNSMFFFSKRVLVVLLLCLEV